MDYINCRLIVFAPLEILIEYMIQRYSVRLACDYISQNIISLSNSAPDLRDKAAHSKNVVYVLRLYLTKINAVFDDQYI